MHVNARSVMESAVAERLLKLAILIFVLSYAATARSQTCGPTVTVTTPTNGASVTSPVNVQASATSCNTITGWHIYDNNNDVFSGGQVNSINASLNLALGSHTLIVRAWDSTAAFGDQTLTITVGQSCGSISVSVATPQNGATVTSPVNVQASACSPHTVTGWHIYDNNNDVFSAGQVNSINTSLNLAFGSHTLIVRAWDSTAAFADQTLTITVGQGCGSISVTVSTPQNGATVTSPVNVQASACSPHTVTAWHIYDNNNQVFSGGQVNSINPSLNMAVGAHTLIVRAWDSTGAFGDQTFNITVSPGSGAVPASNHVYVVLLENHSYSSVIGSSSMPNLNNMANSYGLATNYFANTHPSIGNYFEMTTGQIITNDDTFSSTVTADNIVRHMISAGKTWREYSENLPSTGYTGGDCCSGYIQHHNPLAYFSDVRGTAQANNLVNFTQLQADINAGTLPNFGFIVPNNCDNAHDCSLTTADNWLQSNIFQTLVQSAPFQAGGDGLLFVVFDESDSSDTANGGGHVAAILIGPKVKNGFRSTTFYQHQSLLRTVEESLGLSLFGDAASAPDMAEFFK